MKLVIETSRPVSQVAKDLLINAGTLANWVKAYRRAHAGDQPELTVDERGRLKEQEREICELQLEIAFLKKGGDILHQRATVTSGFEFIDAEHANPSVRFDGSNPTIIRMCE